MDAGGRQFLIDRFQRSADDPSAGFGITAVLEGGKLLEKVMTLPYISQSLQFSHLFCCAPQASEAASAIMYTPS
jgi:hypothetical protein